MSPTPATVIGALAVVGFFSFGNPLLAQDRRLIAIGGMLHESNTYSEARTGIADFNRNALFRGNEILDEYSTANNEITGYIEGCSQIRLRPLPNDCRLGRPVRPRHR